ncbi:hypothetical protein [Streptomyces griseoaurantiacus]|uniref:hypothetical protein n=1 Tax=Streptomyces griseoaurantiacus TaxID=68213 RepID=UPI00369AD8F4
MEASTLALSPALLFRAGARAARGDSPLRPLGVTVSSPTPGLVRTIVPAIVGSALSFLAAHHVSVPSDWETPLELGLTGLLGGAYWYAADLLQSRWPAAGLLLGSTARPTYTGRHRKTSVRPTTATSDLPPEDQP